MRTTALSLLLLASLAMPGAARAYVIKNTSKGSAIHWQDRASDFTVAKVGDAARDARLVRAAAHAARAWSDSGQVSVAVFGPATAEVAYDGASGNVIAWRDRAWDDADAALAVTLLHYRTDTGELLDADVLVNAVDHEWADAEDPTSPPFAFDLTNTLTHELGHALGLGHSEEREATMFARSPAMETAKRDLHPDDEAALDVLYGALPELEAIADGTGSVELASPAGCQSVGGDASWTVLSVSATAAWLSRGRRTTRTRRSRRAR